MTTLRRSVGRSWRWKGAPLRLMHTHPVDLPAVKRWSLYLFSFGVTFTYKKRLSYARTRMPVTLNLGQMGPVCNFGSRWDRDLKFWTWVKDPKPGIHSKFQVKRMKGSHAIAFWNLDFQPNTHKTYNCVSGSAFGGGDGNLCACQRSDKRFRC